MRGKKGKRLGQPVPLACKILQAVLLRLHLRFTLPRLPLRGLGPFCGGGLFQNALIQRGQAVLFPQSRLFQPPHRAGAAHPVQLHRQHVHFRLSGTQGKGFGALLRQALHTAVARLCIRERGLRVPQFGQCALTLVRGLLQRLPAALHPGLQGLLQAVAVHA